MSIELKKTGDDVDVYLDGRLFTSCVNSAEYKAPFMGPVLNSGGVSFTRPERHHKEHPHQRSVFIGIGDVNGYDFWNEHAKPLGLIRAHDVRTQGGETPSVVVSSIWQGRRGKKFLDEERVYTFSKVDDTCVRVDIALTLTANYGDIRFGKTKEAGPLGIRVADEMRVKEGTGRFINSEGGVNEDECWGESARWCNYSGTVGGKLCGIAAFDHPGNERYPTAWHVRNYGLMALNNLFFKGGFKLRKGESVSYTFTICFWEGAFDAEAFSKNL